MKYSLLTAILLIASLISQAQSFDEAKKSLVNYVKRMYTNSPFEGGKKIETDEFNVCAVAIPAAQTANEKPLNMACTSARTAFGEPCVQFEHLGRETASNSVASDIFLCMPLSQYLKSAYEKKPFDGARIVQAPMKDVFISVVTLENAKYTSMPMRDRVAQVKAKQYANTMFNGSTITSDMIIRTETSSTGASETITTELLREQSMGFVEGMEQLTSFEAEAGKTTYVFYREISKQ
jgi:hypothetical protein